MTLLAIGTDVRPGEHRYGLTDVMRAVRVDFLSQRVTTLEFPRDLWVYIPGIESRLNTDHQKLNTAFAYGSPDNGPSLLASTVKCSILLRFGSVSPTTQSIWATAMLYLSFLSMLIPRVCLM